MLSGPGTDDAQMNVSEGDQTSANTPSKGLGSGALGAATSKSLLLQIRGWRQTTN